MNKRYVLGDLHGAYSALQEVLSLARFDFENDELIFIGDLADGCPEFELCLDLLLSIRKFTPIMGNHDNFILEFLDNGTMNPLWKECGGMETYLHIINTPTIIDKLKTYFSKVKWHYYLDGKLFVHGGCSTQKPIVKQKNETFIKNRTLFKQMKKKPHTIHLQYDNKRVIEEIFIGHTPTGYNYPIQLGNLINIDTGIKNGGVLTLMDIDTKKYFVSSKTKRNF